MNSILESLTSGPELESGQDPQQKKVPMRCAASMDSRPPRKVIRHERMLFARGETNGPLKKVTHKAHNL